MVSMPDENADPKDMMVDEDYLRASMKFASFVRLFLFLDNNNALNDYTNLY
jgi:hypothetical protein